MSKKVRRSFTPEFKAEAVALIKASGKRDKYGLTLHPDKTRLVPFGRPRQGGPRPETFDLLGFTHYWGRSRRGKWVILQKTARSRLARALRRVAEYCRRHRHDPLSEQQEQLRKKLQGHYGYYRITGNSQAQRNRGERTGDIPFGFRLSPN